MMERAPSNTPVYVKEDFQDPPTLLLNNWTFNKRLITIYEMQEKS